VLGRLADAVVLVVRAGETNRDQAMAARRRLAEDGIPLLGTILNDWNPDSLGYTANYSYYAKTAGAGKKS
jgi:polysaccharide biosynthesis transport protein